MCETCGCGLPEAAKRRSGEHPREHVEEAVLYRGLLAANDAQARENREHLLARGVLGVNLMSGPGAGKTSLIEALARRTRGRLRLGVIEGDLATDRDARRIRALGLPVHQVVTGSTCHLDAAMVHDALHRLPLDALDILFVENVGNLVCPGVYDLGCQLDGVLLSVTEGDDKVAKYPVAFRRANFLCISKTDLLPHVSFDVSRPGQEARVLKGDLELFYCSSVTGEGTEALLAYLEAGRAKLS